MAAFAVSADMRKEGTDAVEDSHKVHVEYPSPILEGSVVDASEAADTRIVANHTDFAECLVRLLGRTLDAGNIRNVAGNAADIRAKILQALDRGRQRVGLDIGEHHVYASLCKGATKREPDPARPACYECCLTSELPHVPPNCLLPYRAQPAPYCVAVMFCRRASHRGCIALNTVCTNPHSTPLQRRAATMSFTIQHMSGYGFPVLRRC